MFKVTISQQEISLLVKLWHGELYIYLKVITALFYKYNNQNYRLKILVNR